MIVGIGLDLVDIREFQAEVDEKREEWLVRVFTTREREYCGTQADPYRHFAGTFAAKEANERCAPAQRGTEKEAADQFGRARRLRPVTSRPYPGPPSFLG